MILKKIFLCLSLAFTLFINTNNIHANDILEAENKDFIFQEISSTVKRNFINKDQPIESFEQNTFNLRGKQKDLPILVQYFYGLLQEKLTNEELSILFDKLSVEDQDFIKNHFLRELNVLIPLMKEESADKILSYYFTTPYEQMQTFILYISIEGYSISRDDYFKTFDKNTDHYKELIIFDSILKEILNPPFIDDELIAFESAFNSYEASKASLSVNRDIDSYNDMVASFLLLPKQFEGSIPRVFPYLENMDSEKARIDSLSGAERLPDQLKTAINNALSIDHSSNRQHSTKEWTIRFNKKVLWNPDGVVYIINMSKNTLVPIDTVYTNDNKITIFPKELAIPKDQYIVFVSNIHAEDGSILSKDIKIPFIYNPSVN